RRGRRGVFRNDEINGHGATVVASSGAVASHDLAKVMQDFSGGSLVVVLALAYAGEIELVAALRKVRALGSDEAGETTADASGADRQLQLIDREHSAGVCNAK